MRWVVPFAILSLLSAQSPSGLRSLGARERVALSGKILVSPASPGLAETVVRRARVSLTAADGTGRTADSQDDGTFQFPDLAEGVYHVTVEKPGLVLISGGIASGAPIAVAVAKTTTLDLLMARGAALQGRVRREDDEPVANIVVSAARFVAGPYGRRLVAVQQARTDDRGEFRIHTLAPGSYYLTAAPDPAVVAQRAQAGPRALGMVPTYYPSTADSDTASPLVLSVGQEILGIELAAKLEPLSSVTVSVRMSANQAVGPILVRLQAVGAAPGSVRGFVRPQKAEYYFPAVPPGDYWVTAVARSGNGDREYSAARVSVSGESEWFFNAPTSAMISVPGRIEIAGGGVLPSNLEVVSHELDYELPSLTAQPARGAPVSRDGGFTAEVFGRRVFRVQNLPPDWILKEVWLDDRNVTDAGTDFKNPDRPGLLRILLASNGGSVTGAVTDEKGERIRFARVLVFSRDAALWGPRTRYVKSAEAGPDGAFAVRGLIAGDYFAIATTRWRPDEWHDPVILEQLRQAATPVTVTQGGSVSVDLRMKGQ